MRCFRDQRGREHVGAIIARQRLQALPTVRATILGRLVTVDDETVAERHDRITTHLTGDERCVHVALVRRIQTLPRQRHLPVNSAAGFACLALAWSETDMAIQRGFDDAGQIMTIAHILQREQTVTRRLRQCRLPPSVGGSVSLSRAALRYTSKRSRLTTRTTRGCPLPGNALERAFSNPSTSIRDCGRVMWIPYGSRLSRQPGHHTALRSTRSR